TIKKAATDVATDNGFTDDSGATCAVTVNWPPKKGNWVDNTSSVEVIIDSKYVNFVVNGSGVVEGRAVATCDSSATTLNAMVLTDSSGAKAFWDHSGNFTLDGSAAIQVNSTNSQAAYIDTNGTVTGTMNIVGGSAGGSGTTFSPAPTSGANP